MLKMPNPPAMILTEGSLLFSSLTGLEDAMAIRRNPSKQDKHTHTHIGFPNLYFFLMFLSRLTLLCLLLLAVMAVERPLKRKGSSSDNSEDVDHVFLRFGKRASGYPIY